MKRIHIAAYHQSKFGKLTGMSAPEILRRAVLESCAEIKVESSAIEHHRGFNERRFRDRDLGHHSRERGHLFGEPVSQPSPASSGQCG